MPDEIKPDESLEQAQPQDEAAAVSAVADQPNEPAEAVPESDTGGEIDSGSGNEADQSPEIQDDAAAEAKAEEAMQKMLEEDGKPAMEGESRPDLEDEFPDLSNVKMEPTMADPAEFQQLSPAPSKDATVNNIELLLDVKMPVSIELGRTDMPISEILTLGPGSVVELDKLAGEPVDLLVNDKVIAKGEVVVVDENFGVRITMLMSPEERLKSLAQK